MKLTNKMVLAARGGEPTIASQSPHYIWPKITSKIERAVLKQLHTSLSIYDRSGIFEEFEQLFAQLHSRRHALLFSSGTAAIHAMYVAAGVGPGDEVIAPAYTFFATVTPLLQTGARPVLCDCDENGNISPEEIVSRITSRTKAVVITHMWGVPCQMDEIIKICRSNKLLLLEDCSHAHGATYYDRPVGSFGDMSAWSLQGQKLVTGGEGGVFATNSDEFYYHALSFGHYNKRCRQEIPANHFLRPFATTGLGLKLRAHPLAVVIAKEILLDLPNRAKLRQRYAEKIINCLPEGCGLTPPSMNKKIQPSWYALVLQYDPAKFGGLQLASFYKALVAEGLIEADLPGSTSPLNLLPLFRSPGTALSTYDKPQSHFSYNPGDFPRAEHFYHHALKFPVWSYMEDKVVVEKYCQGISKVINNYKELK